MAGTISVAFAFFCVLTLWGTLVDAVPLNIHLDSVEKLGDRTSQDFPKFVELIQNGLRIKSFRKLAIKLLHALTSQRQLQEQELAFVNDPYAFTVGSLDPDKKGNNKGNLLTFELAGDVDGHSPGLHYAPSGESTKKKLIVNKVGINDIEEQKFNRGLEVILEGKRLKTLYF